MKARREVVTRVPAALGALALGTALLAGCGTRQAPPGEPAQPQAAAPESNGGGAAAEGDKSNVFAPLENDVQRAKDVQKTVDEQAERLKQEIEKQTGGGDDSH